MWIGVIVVDDKFGIDGSGVLWCGDIYGGGVVVWCGVCFE